MNNTEKIIILRDILQIPNDLRIWQFILNNIEKKFEINKDFINLFNEKHKYEDMSKNTFYLAINQFDYNTITDTNFMILNSNWSDLYDNKIDKIRELLNVWENQTIMNKILENLEINYIIDDWLFKKVIEKYNTNIDDFVLTEDLINNIFYNNDFYSISDNEFISQFN